MIFSSFFSVPSKKNVSVKIHHCKNLKTPLLRFETKITLLSRERFQNIDKNKINTVTCL